MRSGVRLGIDVGKARVGVARSDFHGMLAMPVETLSRDDGTVEQVRRIVVESEAFEVIVGHPLALSGQATASTADAVGFAEALVAAGVSVRLVDERLSTVTAQQTMRANGRSERKSRSVIDQAAAVIILQHALDSERSTGRPPGASLAPAEGPE